MQIGNFSLQLQKSQNHRYLKSAANNRCDGSPAKLANYVNARGSKRVVRNFLMESRAARNLECGPQRKQGAKPKKKGRHHPPNQRKRESRSPPPRPNTMTISWCWFFCHHSWRGRANLFPHTCMKSATLSPRWSPMTKRCLCLQPPQS